MDVYQITNIITEEKQYFKIFKTLCSTYNFSYKSLLNKKNTNGLPIIKDNYIIKKITVK